MWIIEIAAAAWLGKTIVGMCLDVMQAHYDYKEAQQRAQASRERLAALQVKFNG
jgi:hypothetical protein